MQKEMSSVLERNGNKKDVVKLVCFPGEFLSGVSRFFVSDGWSSVRNKIGRCRIKCGKTPNLMGFTLIELLVVVLIIGILAAVALPQYQKAVIKSRYATLKSLTKSMADAEEVYYLANGEYTRDLDMLGVMPENKLNTSTSSRFDYSWGYCFAHTPEPGTNSAAVGCRNAQHQIGYEVYLLFSAHVPGKAKCRVEGASTENDIRNQICKAETGTAEYAVSGNDVYWWTYP